MDMFDTFTIRSRAGGTLICNSIGVSNSVAMVSTASVRGCVINLRRFATSDGLITSISDSNTVSIVSTASVRGCVVNLSNYKGINRRFIAR